MSLCNQYYEKNGILILLWNFVRWNDDSILTMKMEKKYLGNTSIENEEKKRGKRGNEWMKRDRRMKKGKVEKGSLVIAFDW